MAITQQNVPKKPIVDYRGALEKGREYAEPDKEDKEESDDVEPEVKNGGTNTGEDERKGLFSKGAYFEEHGKTRVGNILGKIGSVFTKNKNKQ